jgi:hypothetical protein
MEQEVDFIVYHEKASEFFWKNNYHPTNKVFRIGFSDALRIQRVFPSAEILRDPLKIYNPALFRDHKMFGLIGDADTESGFGNCTVNLVKYSTEEGYDVRWVGRSLAQGVPSLSHAGSKEIPEGLGMIWHEQPKHTWLQSPFKKNICILPFETTRIPPSWVEKINSFDAVFTLSKQNIQMMKDSGVTVPVELIYWGTNTQKFRPIERVDDGIFTFGTLGALSIRKGTDLLVRAFELAFSPRVTDVRLLCKTSYNHYNFASKDQRIKVELTPWDHDELMKKFFGEVDCFVLPTRGEGWGLPLTEAMATGLPVITTGWSGPMEFVTPDVGWLLDYKLVPAKEFSETVYKEPCGDWAEPSLDDLVVKMRYAYEHQDEVKQKGQAATKHIQENFTWEETQPRFYELLDKYL